MSLLTAADKEVPYDAISRFDSGDSQYRFEYVEAKQRFRNFQSAGYVYDFLDKEITTGKMA